MSSGVDYLSLHEQVKHLRHGEFRRLGELMDKREEAGGELQEKEEKQLKDLRTRAEEEILRSADVVTTTCVAAFDRRLKGIRFS